MFDNKLWSIRNRKRHTNSKVLNVINALSSYILDSITSSVMAFSLRKLRKAATLCVRVRRTADDYEEDIGFVGTKVDEGRLLELTNIPYTDLISNGTFTTMTGWTTNVGTVSAVANEAVVTTTTTGTGNGFYSTTTNGTVVGRKYNLICEVFSTQISSIRACWNENTINTTITLGVWNTISLQRVIATNGTLVFYNNGATTIGHQFKVRNVRAYDITGTEMVNMTEAQVANLLPASKLSYTNILLNPNFVDASNWVAGSTGTVSSSDNKLIVDGNGLLSLSQAYQTTSITSAGEVNKKYFVHIKFKAITSVPTFVRITLGDTTTANPAGNVIFNQIDGIFLNKEYDLFASGDIVASFTGTLRFFIYAQYANNTDQGNSIYEVRQASMILQESTAYESYSAAKIFNAFPFTLTTDTTGLTGIARTDAMVATWYDQTTNGNNATQATAGNQPRLVNNGDVEKDITGECFVKGIANSRLTAATPATIINQVSIAVKTKAHAFLVRGAIAGQDFLAVANGFGIYTFETSNYYNAQFITTSTTSILESTTLDKDKALIVATRNQSTPVSKLYHGNLLVDTDTTSLGSIAATNPFNIFTNSTGASTYLGHINSVIVFNEELDQVKVNKLENSMGG